MMFPLRSPRSTTSTRPGRATAVVIGAAAGFALASSGTAFALWSASDGSSPAQASADTIPAGSTPTVAANGAGTNVNFSTVSSGNGTRMTSYTVTRYNAYTGSSSGTFSCSASGTAASCADTPGTGYWQYTDTPVYGTTSWTGAESGRSSGYYISSASGLSPTTGVVGTGATISAAGFKASAGLSVTVGGASATVTSGGTTTSAGTSTVAFTVPAVPAGNEAVVVSDGTNSVTSSTPFAVTPSVSGPTPSSGTAGSSATVSVQGFAASSNLTVKVGTATATITGTSKTDSTGSATNVAFTVPSSATGTQTVSVTDGSSDSANGGTFTVTVAQSLVITAANTDNGNTKMDFQGTGGTTGGTITVYICSGTVSSCTSATQTGGSASTNGTSPTGYIHSDGSWLTGQSSTNLRSGSYSAQAFEGSASSPVFPFSLP